jgi:membrane associated rhomboid family serine protease
MHLSRWIDVLEERCGHWAIPHLPRGIVLLNALAFFLIGTSPDFRNMLTLDPAAILQGEVWRLVSYLFIPGTQSVFWIIFYLIFLWSVGGALEQEWGAFRLNLFYLIGMVALTVVAFFVTGSQVETSFLNLSLLLAYGTLFPRATFYLIIIPIQARWLAWFYAAVLVLSFLVAPPLRPVILASVLNYAVFFLPGWWTELRERRAIQRRRQRFQDRDE